MNSNRPASSTSGKTSAAFVPTSAHGSGAEFGVPGVQGRRRSRADRQVNGGGASVAGQPAQGAGADDWTFDTNLIGSLR